MSYEQMLADRVAAHEGVKKIRDLAAREGRELVDEERKEIDRLLARFDQLSGDIQRYEQEQQNERALAAPQPRKAPANGGDGDKPRAIGFGDFGQFAMAVYNAGTKNGTDPRLTAIQAAAGDVITTTDGYPIPPEFRQEIQRGLLLETSILSRCRQFQTASNEIKMPAYEAIPGTSGALQATWTAESAPITEQKAQLGEFRLPLHKLTALVYVTEEMLEDAPLIESFLRTEVPRVIVYEVDRAIVRGTGAGQPLGVLNAPATITQAAEGSQPADTINFANLRKMYGRLHPAADANAIWLTSPSARSYLMTVAFEVKNVAGTDNVGGEPVFLPANSLAGRPFDTLLGRPVVVTEHAGGLGDKGDLILGDWQIYGAALKQAGINVATSMHIKFDEDKMAFRFTFRAGGQPLLNGPVTLPNDATTLSAFVTLAERA